MTPVTFIQQKNTVEPLYEVFKPEKEQQTIPMFSKLFEILPDAEDLLNLEPEELAGPLLVSLKGSKQIDLEDEITHRSIESEIKNGVNRNNPNLNYPYKSHEDVLFALMEAWQCLLSEGFVAQRPANLRSTIGMSQNTLYFVTRRGQKIEKLEDYEAYRKADLLRKHQLHPIIADKVWRIFAQGSYRPAVLEAFIQVEVAVREAGGYTKDNYGRVLMETAFNVNDGKLTDEHLHESEKLGMRNLFAGAISLYKNPSSHREVEFAPEEAAEIIIIASHLLQIVDSCAEGTSNPPN